MSDEAGGDEKVLAVPQSDPRFEEMRALDGLQQHLLKEVEYFFEIYKELEGKETAVLGWYPAERAHQVIREAHDAFLRQQGVRLARQD
jgi:inorganic pyrophosphatase